MPKQRTILLQKQKFSLRGLSTIILLGFFNYYWDGNYPDLQDPTNKNIVNCDEKLKTVLLGRSQVQLFELPMIVKLHFPKVPKSW